MTVLADGGKAVAAEEPAPPDTASTSTASASTATATATATAGASEVTASGKGPGDPDRIRPLLPFTPRRIAVVGLAWLLVTVVGVGLVVYGLGPLLEQRDQRHLLADYRVDIEQAANEAFGLPGVEEITEAPEPGDPVAIVEIPSLDFRQVVVEGVGPQQTRHGPGHVPGTAGPGQPGNSAVVGRQGAFGGPFSEIDGLGRGDEIVVTTTQGQSLYVVSDERHGRLRSAPADDDRAADPTASTDADEDDGDFPSVELADRLTVDEVYGPSENDDRLTLITSGSGWPLASNPATVVVAEMETQPFEPTPQGGRSAANDGRDGDAGALATFVLAFFGYAAAGAAAVLLYRRTRPRSAYLMSAPLLVVATVLVAEATARLLPAWF